MGREWLVGVASVIHIFVGRLDGCPSTTAKWIVAKEEREKGPVRRTSPIYES
jgi:hypothetical protein